MGMTMTQKILAAHAGLPERKPNPTKPPMLPHPVMRSAPYPGC